MSVFFPIPGGPTNVALSLVCFSVGKFRDSNDSLPMYVNNECVNFVE